MNRHLTSLCFGATLFSRNLLSLGSSDAEPQHFLHVFGSEGPSFAIKEAAMAFEKKNHVQVEVVSGPPNEWLEIAKVQADLVYASAEFMMSDFIHRTELGLEEAGVTPLYLRPSTLLVRPGNPRGIQDFPDLLKPGIKVMVVSGSGQTGFGKTWLANRGT